MSGEQRSVFIAKPIPVLLTLEDGSARRVVARRMTFGHAMEWDRTWFGFTPDWVDFDDAQKQAFAVEVIKAGFPEPVEGVCSPMCICVGNDGLHAIIDRLAADENYGPLDALFGAALEVNRPKDEPQEAAADGGSMLTRRSPAWCLWASRWPTSRISQSSSVRTFLMQRSAIARRGTPPSPTARPTTWGRWRRSSRSSGSAPARTLRHIWRRARPHTAAGVGPN